MIPAARGIGEDKPLAASDATEQADVARATDSARAQYVCFVLFWAWTGILDIGAVDNALSALFLLSCFYCLVRPEHAAAFLVLNGLRLAAFLADSPETPNHQVLLSAASATILICWMRGDALLPERWLARFAPWLRVELLVLYLFTALHKINSDYLSPDTSCATWLFDRSTPAAVAAQLRALPAFGYFVVYASLLLEIGIPLSLAIRRLRSIGLIVGLAFHVFLGLNAFVFSTVVLSFYLLFVPASQFAAVENSGRIAAALRFVRSSRHIQLVSALVVGRLILKEGARRFPDSAASAAAVLDVAPFIWALWILAASVVFLFHRGRPTLQLSKPSGALRSFAVAIVFPTYLLVCGLSPYLGLRTVPAFSMFSNLITEGNRANHLFMPNLRVAAYQDDLVTVLQPEASDGRAIRPFISLRQSVQAAVREGATRDILVVYRRQGELHSTARAEADPVLMAELSWFERNWLLFRAIPRKNAPVTCTW